MILAFQSLVSDTTLSLSLRGTDPTLACNAVLARSLPIHVQAHQLVSRLSGYELVVPTSGV